MDKIGFTVFIVAILVSLCFIFFTLKENHQEETHNLFESSTTKQNFSLLGGGEISFNKPIVVEEVDKYTDFLERKGLIAEFIQHYENNSVVNDHTFIFLVLDFLVESDKQDLLDEFHEIR